MSAPTPTELQVEGMTCNNCARHVTEAIQGVSGVQSASVSLQQSGAVVRWKAGDSKNIPAVLKAVSEAGYEAREISGGTMDASQNRWEWNLILGLMVTGLLMIGEWGFQLMGVPWFRWTAFVLAGVVQVFCGAQFYRGAWRQIKVGSSNMDTLVALGSTTAFGYSAWVLLSGSGLHVYFMEAAAIISLISAGHWLEARVSDKAGAALRSLLNLAPQTARRIVFTSAGEEEVPIAELKVDDRVVLRPGDRVPVDGVVAEGESAVDEAMLTGESVPVEKKSGSELFAGTVNRNGRLVMRVTATGEATALAHIIAAVQRAQTSRANIQRLGDRVSNVFVPIIITIALIAGLWWGLLPGSAHHVHAWLAQWLRHSHVPMGAAAGFIIAASVLIVACPCAMGLATPAAIMAAANTAAKRGILIRDGVALEKAGRITAIAFDKTGTLTEGRLALFGPWIPEDSEPATELARKIAASLAKPSNHPISKAFFSQEYIELRNWQEVAGSGVVAQWQPTGGEVKTVRLGSLSWLRENKVVIPENESVIETWRSQGATLVGVAVEDSIIGVFGLRDFLKPGTRAVILRLQAEGLKTFMVSGDSKLVAQGMAREIGIVPENVFAGVRPEQKAEFIKKLQAQGERVAFVGDGINDAPALTQADLGIAVGRASDVAREAADIILLKSEIEAVPEALGLARATLRIIKQNLFWAFFYNALGVPLAAMGFVSPIWCAAAMGVSDLIVIGNALRLLNWRAK